MSDRDDAASASDPPVPWFGHVGRGSVDWFFHNAHSEQVVLNQQADFKASVVITASAVILSIAAVQIDNDPMGIAAGVIPK